MKIDIHLMLWGRGVNLGSRLEEGLRRGESATAVYSWLFVFPKLVVDRGQNTTFRVANVQ